MELSAYLQILKRRWWIIILTAITTLGVFLYVRQLIPASNEASAVIRIVPYAPGDAPYTQLVYAERIMRTYVTIASSSPVLSELQQNLNLGPERPASIDASVIPDSELLEITVEDADPTVARDAANMVAEILMNQKNVRDIQIYLIEQATLPKPASLLHDLMYGAFALVVGLGAGIVLAFISENLDTRLFTTEQIEAITGLPTLARVPKTRKIKDNKYLLSNPYFNHAIRSLRTILLLRDSETPVKTILITSSYPNDGKSTIISHLAISLALAERNVLLIDADLHLPSLHQIFNLNNQKGLSNYLNNPVDLSSFIHKSEIPGLSVLPSGPAAPNSTELLGSQRTRTLIDQLQGKFDHILIDAPAFLGMPDAATMAPFADFVILVTKLRATNEPAMRSTLQQFKQLGVQPAGVVVNYAEKGPESSYYGYYHYLKNYDPVGDLAAAEPDGDGVREVEGEAQPDFMDGQEDIAQTLTEIDTQKDNNLTSLGKDDLTEIRGIGPRTEKALNWIGITTFVQLAEQNPDDLGKRIDGKIPIEQIQPDQWISQARALCKTTGDAQVLDHRDIPNEGSIEL